MGGKCIQRSEVDFFFAISPRFCLFPPLRSLLHVFFFKKEKQEAPRLSTRKSAVVNCMEEETHSTFLLDGVKGVGGGGRGFRPYVGTRF